MDTITFRSSIVSQTIGVILLIGLCTGLVFFPVATVPLSVLFILAAAAMVFRPLSWLIILPLFTVTLDLTQLSGRFLLNEFDFLVWLVAGLSLICGAIGFPAWKQHRVALCLIISLAVYYLVSSQFWQLANYLTAPIDGNPYYLPEYGAKLAKGVIWALLLLPLTCWSIAQPQFKQYLSVGIFSAAIALLCVVLWERGVIATLLEDGIGYALFNALLDSSSSYRTTGIFAEMHTGGEVIDGVIMLLMMPSLYCAATQKGWPRVLSIVAILALLYVTFVGFTRATYAAVFASMLVFSVIAARKMTTQFAQLAPFALPLTAFALVTLLCVYLVGTAGLIYTTGTLLGSWFVIKLILQRLIAYVCLLGGNGVFAYFLISDHFSHQWIASDNFSIALLALAVCLAPISIIWLAHRAKQLPLASTTLGLVLLLPLLIVIKQMVGGYQMTDRMSQVGKDWQTRVIHWNKVQNSGDNDALAVLFGNGMGTFPRNYVFHYPDTIREIGSFGFGVHQGQTSLKLGGADDMALAQQISVNPNSSLTISVKLLNPQKARVGVYICERNVIFAQNTARQCNGAFLNSDSLISVADEGVELHTLNMQLRGISQGLADWRPFFHIKNYTSASVVDVLSIEVVERGQQLLSNPTFAAKLDHWFFYNDFAHLPWHIKNTYLHWYYETGIVGSLIIALLIFISIRRSRQHSILLFAASVAGVIGFGVIWMFGTPMDSVRVALFTYLQLIALSVASKE